MNRFDFVISTAIDRLSQQAPALTGFMHYLVDAELFKGGLVVALLWAMWFQPGRRRDRREIILATLLACFVALFMARLLSHVLPFRPRPINHFHPQSAAAQVWGQWSSFPSDHAALFMTLATGLVLLSRPLGVFAVLYVLVVICVPRVYVELHYPTDIVAGALLGAGFACLGNVTLVRRRLMRPVLRWGERRPRLMYACLFLLSFQLATLFIDLRLLGHLMVGRAARGIDGTVAARDLGWAQSQEVVGVSAPKLAGAAADARCW